MSQTSLPSADRQGAPFPGAQWLTGLVFDPSGRVFLHEGSIYRSIYPSAAERVRQMFSSGLITDLVQRGLLIPTVLTDLKADDGSLILRHEKVAFLTSGFEWSRPQLRDAALTWIDLNLVLAEKGLATVDAHWANIGQIGCCQPVWLDFGSISKLQTGDQGFAEFNRYYLNPLKLAAKSSGLARVARALNQSGGLNDYELSSLGFAALPMGGRQMQNGFDRMKRAWRKLSKRWFGAAKSHPDTRISLLQQKREEVTALEFPGLGTTWGEYHPSALFDRADELPPDARRSAVLDTIQRVKAKRVIDLASNAGFYSFYAARLGAEVLAVDFDEKAIERLYAFARSRSERLNLSCACADVTRAPKERPGLRREADLVLALALTHHLILGQGFSIPAVLDILQEYTTDKLLVEFMPHGLGGTEPKPNPLPTWYTREHFESELRARFERVTVVTENQLPQWRVLFLAEGKRA